MTSMIDISCPLRMGVGTQTSLFLPFVTMINIIFKLNLPQVIYNGSRPSLELSFVGQGKK